MSLELDKERLDKIANSFTNQLCNGCRVINVNHDYCKIEYINTGKELKIITPKKFIIKIRISNESLWGDNSLLLDPSTLPDPGSTLLLRHPFTLLDDEVRVYYSTGEIDATFYARFWFDRMEDKGWTCGDGVSKYYHTGNFRWGRTGFEY